MQFSFLFAVPIQIGFLQCILNLNSQCHRPCLLHTCIMYMAQHFLVDSQWKDTIAWITLVKQFWTIPVKYATASLAHLPQTSTARWEIAQRKLHSALIFLGVFVSLPNLHNSLTGTEATKTLHGNKLHYMWEQFILSGFLP